MLSSELEVDGTSGRWCEVAQKTQGSRNTHFPLLIKGELAMIDVPFFLLFLLVQGLEHQAVDRTSMTNRVLKC